MRLGILLTFILVLTMSGWVQAQDLCQEARRSIQLPVKAAETFALYRGQEKIVYKSKFTNKAARLQDLVPGLPAGFSSLNYVIKGHGRMKTTVYLVVDASLIEAYGPEVQELIKKERVLDDRLLEYFMVRKKVSTELMFAGRKITKGEDTVEQIVEKFRYLEDSTEELPENLRTIQAHLKLFLKMTQLVAQLQIEKKVTVVKKPEMVEFARQLQRLAERISPNWDLVSAGCHGPDSRYQVYGNTLVRGVYLILEVQ